MENQELNQEGSQYHACNARTDIIAVNVLVQLPDRLREGLVVEVILALVYKIVWLTHPR